MLVPLLLASIIGAVPATGVEMLNVGDEAPQFTLAAVNPDSCGLKRFSLNHFKSLEDGKRPKLYLITFFASWCEPCKKELPALEELHRKHSGSGLMVVNISIDKEQDKKQELVDLAVKNGVTFPVLWDPSTVTGKRYRVPNTLPYEVLLDADGRVVKVLVGPKPEELDALMKEIGRLLGGKAETPQTTPANVKPVEAANSQVREDK